MPEEYDKLAEGIVKGSVPMVASFVERYVSDEEAGFYVGDREHVEGDIRVHVTVFGQLERANALVADSVQLGVVDLQQLPDGRVWMVVGASLGLDEGQDWATDLYSAMVRRMAQRLVQFGFLDAPNRPRLRSATTLALSQAGQALKPPRHMPVRVAESARPAQAAAAPVATASATAPQPEAQSPPSLHASTPSVARSEPPPAAAGSFVPSAAAASAAPVSMTSLSGAAGTGLRLDTMLTVAMVIIWLVACGLLGSLLFLLLR